MKSITGKIFRVALFFFVGVFIMVGFFQEKLIFIPSKLAKDFTYNFPLDFEEKNIEVEKGIKLNALHFKSKTTKGVILYMHGNAGDLSGWGGVAQDFLPLGYDMFIYDYRGYGKSGGQITSEKQLYADAEAVLEAVKKEYPLESIIIYGRSIGTGIASYLASKNKVKKLVLETPYYNLTWLVKHYYPLLPTFLLKYKLPNNEYLKQVRCPTELIHGTNDEVIPYENSSLLKKEIPQIRLHTIEGGYHNNLSQYPSFPGVIQTIF